MKQRSHCGHLVPLQLTAFGQLGQLRAISRDGVFLPLADGAIVFDFLQSGQDRSVGKIVEFFAAEIIIAALHVANPQPPFRWPRWCARFDSQRRHGACRCPRRAKQRRFQEGNVFIEELFLQRLGSRRDNDTLAGAQHGEKVGERLARARPGLDDQVAPLFEGLLDGLRHA